MVKNTPATAGDARHAGSIPGSGRFSGEGNGSPLQYSCLENSMDRRAWRAAVHGVAKESDRPSDGAHTDHTQHSSIMFFIPHFFFSRPLLRACADRNLVPKGTVSTNTLTARHGNEGSIFLASLGDFQINLFLSFLETSILESPVILVGYSLQLLTKDNATVLFIYYFKNPNFSLSPEKDIFEILVVF